MPNFDLVITDYSSICLEFLLLDKPTIFYVYDLDDYRHNPGLPEEFWQLVPGPRVQNFDELLGTLDKPDQEAAARQRVRQILFEFKPGQAAQNAFQAIISSRARL